MGLSAALLVELARHVEGCGEAGVAQTVVHDGRARQRCRRALRRSHTIPPKVGDVATPAPFDATDERFIDFLVDEALKTWRARIS